jgi:RimJ/RimL family protein N-acetyltransferase
VTRRLETGRLSLRPLKPADWPDVWAYTSDPDVMRYLPIGPFDRAEARAWVERWSDWGQRGSGWPDMWAVTLRGEERLIGHLPFEVFSVKHRTREIGWVVHPAYQGQGLATEAARALLDLGFGEFNLHRVVATCDPRNGASARIMEKLGMRREGHFRRDVQLDGQWCDEYFYAILQDEWRDWPEAGLYSGEG